MQIGSLTAKKSSQVKDLAASAASRIPLAEQPPKERDRHRLIKVPQTGQEVKPAGQKKRAAGQGRAKPAKGKP